MSLKKLKLKTLQVDSPTLTERICCSPLRELLRSPERGVLLLEDLSHTGFRCLPKTEVHSFKHAKLAIE